MKHKIELLYTLFYKKHDAWILALKTMDIVLNNRKLRTIPV